jgi:hypothetical protein
MLAQLFRVDPVADAVDRSAVFLARKGYSNAGSITRRHMRTPVQATAWLFLLRRVSLPTALSDEI